jgi:hypothetical protein
MGYQEAFNAAAMTSGHGTKPRCRWAVARCRGVKIARNRYTPNPCRLKEFRNLRWAIVAAQYRSPRHVAEALLAFLDSGAADDVIQTPFPGVFMARFDLTDVRWLNSGDNCCGA